MNVQKLVLVILCFFFGMSISKADEPASQSNQVDQIFSDWDRLDSPGYHVSVIQDGAFVHQRGYGMANLEHAVPLNADTVFCVMSVSKSFSTVCVAIAMDQGFFAPDDDVRKYVPELNDFGKVITIRDLLKCHSGLRDYYHALALSGRDVADAYTSADVMDLITRQKSLLFDPGERWSYSNSDWFLLAEVIRRTTGKTFRQFADEQLFSPLGMRATFFQDNPRTAVVNRANGHGHDGERFVQLQANTDSWHAAGGLHTTANDMLQWDAFLTGNQTIKAGKYLKEFLNDGSLLENEECLSVFPKQKHRDKRRFWYTGAGMGFMAHYLRFPDDLLSVIVMGNNSTNRGWHFAVDAVPRAADIYLGPSTVSADSTRPTSTERKPIALSERRLEELQAFSGVYRRAAGNFIEISVRNGHLFLEEFTSHWQYGFQEKLRPVGENRFRLPHGYHEFELSFDHDTVVDTIADEAIVDRTRPAIVVQFDDGDNQTWAPVTPTKYESAKLQAFAGEYFCDDLEALHRVTVANGELFVQYNLGRKRRHRPTVRDTFIPMNQQFCIPVKFQRSESGAIRGFTMEFDRSGTVFFKRR